MALLITYVLVALAVSFVCSLLEASLLTITPSAINTAKQKGLSWASRMEAYKADIDRPISAILTLNTIAHTMGPPAQAPNTRASTEIQAKRFSLVALPSPSCC